MKQTNNNIIIEGLKEVTIKLVEFKKSKNSPIIVSEKGKILELDPYEVEKQLKSKFPNSFM